MIRGLVALGLAKDVALPSPDLSRQLAPAEPTPV